jgi:hypothetical protein
MKDEVRIAIGRRTWYAQAQFLAIAGLAAQPAQQQFDHMQVPGFGGIQQAVLHRPACVAIEELGEFVGAVAVDVYVGAVDFVQDAFARQHLLGHFAIRERNECIELGREAGAISFRRGEDDAAGAEVQPFDGALLRACGH